MDLTANYPNIFVSHDRKTTISPSSGKERVEDRAILQLTEKLDGKYLLRLNELVKKHRLIADGPRLVTSFSRVNQLVTDLSKAQFNVKLSKQLIEYFRATVDKEEYAEKLAESTISRMERYSGRTLRSYQLVDIKWMHTTDCGINALEQRLGKTCEICAVLRQTGNIVVGPLASVAVWFNEIKIWRKDLTPVIVQNAAKFRWPRNNEVVIMHYQAVPPVGQLGTTKNGRTKPGLIHSKDKCPSNIVVAFDECQWIKNPKAERTKRCNALSDIVAAKNGIRWLVTGTPVPNRRKELWDLLAFLRIATKLFPAGKDWFIKAGPEEDEFIASMLSKHMVRRLRKDVITQLPKITRDVIDVPTDPIYKGILDELWQKAIEKGVLDDHENLIEVLKMDPDFMMYSKIRSGLAKAKIPYMLNWIEEMEEAEEKAVVVSAHKSPVEALSLRDGWAGITGDVEPKTRQGFVDAFKEGKLYGLGLTVKTGGMAIDLSIAGNMLIVDLDWTPGNNAQAEDRIVNVSKADPLLYKYLVLDHPLEKHIHSVLRYKQEQITRLDTVGNKCDDPNRSIRENKEILTDQLNKLRTETSEQVMLDFLDS